MQRRTLLNLTLLASAAALGAWLWLTRPAPPEPAQPLLDIAAANVTRIEIQRPGTDREPLVLKREAGGWRLTAPADARADAAQVRSLLALTRAVSQRRYPASEINRAEAGLKPPAARLQFNQQPAIAIGGRGPLGDSRYVQIGDIVLLADLPNLGGLELPWTQWIDPGLIAAGADLAQLRLPELTLTQAETGGWRVTPAERDRGADVAQRTVDTWRHARARTIVPASGRQAMATVELVFADGHTRRLGVIARTPELVLRDTRLGVDYHLAANKGPPLLEMQHPQLPQGLGADTPERSKILLTPPTGPTEGS